MTKRRFSPLTLAAGAVLAGAILAGVAAPLGAQVACDTLQTGGARFAALGAFGSDRPFTRDSANGEVLGRRRHAVLTPGMTGAGAGTAARGGRVRKDGSAPGVAPAAARRIPVTKEHAGLRVRKDSVPGDIARQDSTARPFCPQIAALPGGGGGIPAPEGSMHVATETAPGDVVPPSRLPGARGGWFSLPRVLGGLLLGGTAVALGGSSGGDTPALVTPLVPTTPVTPTTPSTPTTPGTPTTPTAAPGTPDTPPATPTTPLLPVTPGTPDTPTPPTPLTPTEVVPEPSSLALVGLGGMVMAAAGARRRRR